MRIVLIAHHVAPISAPFCGGVESLTWYLARWLARRGHDVVMHAPAGSRVPGVVVRELDLSPDLSAAARSDVDMPPDTFMAAHHAYQRVMLDLARDPDACDVVHSHSLHYLPLLLSPTVAMPVVTTLHTPPTPWLESALRSVTAHRAPVLSAVSPATRDAWAGIVGDVEVVQNGIDTAAWIAGPGGPDAVWSGRIVPEKAPHLAIDACRAAGMALRIAGPIIDRAYWDALVRPRLGPDVEHVGHLDHERPCALIGRSRIALMTPAWEEPFGLAAAEAMACGTPVAAFARGGLTELIGRDGGRVARPGDVGSLARAVRAASRMDRDGVRRHVERTAGIDAMGRGYERLYEGLVDPVRAPSPIRSRRPRLPQRQALVDASASAS